MFVTRCRRQPNPPYIMITRSFSPSKQKHSFTLHTQPLSCLPPSLCPRMHDETRTGCCLGLASPRRSRPHTPPSLLPSPRLYSSLYPRMSPPSLLLRFASARARDLAARAGDHCACALARSQALLLARSVALHPLLSFCYSPTKFTSHCHIDSIACACVCMSTCVFACLEPA